ncbi:hypothetical protein [Microvirga sp. 2TAF3]|uniref:hypothetical protein n=1 Tax=Microvirga sp. 2TAF3 TaxID=3233014 RepID=UPI003F9DF9EC
MDDGLSPGDRVVIDGSDRLHDGAPVIAVAKDNPATASDVGQQQPATSDSKPSGDPQLRRSGHRR